MPEMDGYETLSIIRNSDHKNIPVISVTAQAMPGDKEKCLEAGADAYIAKPVDADQLIVLLNRFVPWAAGMIMLYNWRIVTLK